MKKIIVILALLSCVWSALAVNISKLNPIETLSVNVPGFKQPMVFNVTLPASYLKETDKRYFMLFDLHPRSQPYLSGMQDWLSHNGEWPWLETIIVNPADYHKEFAQLFERTAKNPADPRLLDAIDHHILKAVASTYRTNGFNIYSGFMSNGAIGLYALLNRPEMFNAYMIATPSLANNFLNITSEAAKKLAQLKGKNRFLYLSIGQHQYEQAHIEPVKQFKQQLAAVAPQSLDWQVNTDNPHYYMSRPIFTVLNGIEKLFSDYHNDLTADSDIAQQGAEAIISYYKELSENKYGFAISAEASLNNLADALLTTKPKQALAIYQKIVSLYPESAYAYSNLAAAYFQLDERKKAITQQKIAVEQSTKMSEWHQNKMKKLLAEYQQTN